MERTVKLEEEFQARLPPAKRGAGSENSKMLDRYKGRRDASPARRRVARERWQKAYKFVLPQIKEKAVARRRKSQLLSDRPTFTSRASVVSMRVPRNAAVTARLDRVERTLAEHSDGTSMDELEALVDEKLTSLIRRTYQRSDDRVGLLGSGDAAKPRKKKKHHKDETLTHLRETLADFAERAAQLADPKGFDDHRGPLKDKLRGLAPSCEALAASVEQGDADVWCPEAMALAGAIEAVVSASQGSELDELALPEGRDADAASTAANALRLLHSHLGDAVMAERNAAHGRALKALEGALAKLRDDQAKLLSSLTALENREPAAAAPVVAAPPPEPVVITKTVEIVREVPREPVVVAAPTEPTVDPALAEAVAQLRAAVGTKAGQRLVEDLSQNVMELREELENLAKQVADPKLLAELKKALKGKADREELLRLLRRIEDLEAGNGGGDDALLRFRCLSCDRPVSPSERAHSPECSSAVLSDHDFDNRTVNTTLTPNTAFTFGERAKSPGLYLDRRSPSPRRTKPFGALGNAARLALPGYALPPMTGAFPRGTTMHHELLRQQAIQFGEVPLHERIAANANPPEAPPGGDKGGLRASPLQKNPNPKQFGRPLSALAIVGEPEKSALRKKAGANHTASFSLPRPEWDADSAQSRASTKRPGSQAANLRSSASTGTIRQ